MQMKKYINQRFSIPKAIVSSRALFKMNALAKLQNIKPCKPYHGFGKLKIGYHQIIFFRTVKNKFGKKNDGNGKSILVELEDEVLFLPQYFFQQINEEDIQELNTTIEKEEKKIYLYFGGKISESK